jgi:hypothetical protein
MFSTKSNIAIYLILITTVTANDPFSKLTNELYSDEQLRTNEIQSSFQCIDPSINCDNHGLCPTLNSSTCKCDKGYVTHDCSPNVQCCYKQESRVKMFLLAFFVSWTGAPLFLLGSVGLGIGILLLCCCGLCLGGIGIGVGQSKENSCCYVIGVVGILATLSAMVWSLALWIMIAAQTEPWNDKNGVPIADW